MTALRDAAFDLSVTGLRKTFGSRVLWSDLSFTVPSGTLVSVTGASGSGKTTLLNCIGLLETFDSGTVAFGEWRLAGKTKPAQARRCFRDVLGFLFQNYGLVESWTVRQNLRIPLRARSETRAARSGAMSEALERVGMAGSESDRIYTLSGGEQQRVALARLMLKAPSLILADEPTSALDHANADLVMDILDEQAGLGALVLISTHSDHIASRCGESIDLTSQPTAV